MVIKQEPEVSPARSGLADRLAKYAYTLPSPSRRAPSRSIAIKPEPTTPQPISPTTKRKVRGGTISPEPTVDLSEEAQAGSAGPGPSTTARIDDDLESLTEEVEYTPLRRSARSSARRRAQPADDAPSDLSEDDYEASSPGSSGDEVETPRSQKRIRIRRASGNQRYLLSTPTRLDEAAAGPSRRSPSSGRRRKRSARHGEDADPAAREVGNSPRRPRAYADPATYGHLRPLPDILAPDLDLVFCGINPGKKSSTMGHHFAHPTNKFWRSLHYSGLTSRLVSTTEDHLLPTEFNYGLTVLVDRPTAEQSELSTLEMRLNALPFTEKLLRYKPRIVCFVGKKIWDVYESVIAKNASPLTHASSYLEAGVKEEPEDGSTSTRSPLASMKIEPADRVIGERAITPLRTGRAGGTPRRAKDKVPFDWTQPRPFRLPLTEGGRIRYTYFWVVPNTSGLERTPLADQIVLFGHLNKFKDEIKAGRVREMGYRDFEVEGVRQTVENMRLAAEARSQGTPQRIKLSPS